MDPEEELHGKDSDESSEEDEDEESDSWWVKVDYAVDLFLVVTNSIIY